MYESSGTFVLETLLTGLISKTLVSKVAIWILRSQN
jgi:hypothetical protein